MALKATIFKADLSIADMDRHYYHDHALTLARHPSETDERMMMRLLAFTLHADESLTFAKGPAVDDEPALWQKDLSSTILLWIDVGLPDEKRIRKACGRAHQVCIYSYGGRSADLWWEQNSSKLELIHNLTVINVPQSATSALAKLAQRTMRLQCTVQEGQVWLADDDNSVQIDLALLKAASSRFADTSH